MQVSSSRVGGEYGNVTLFNTTDMGEIYLGSGNSIRIGQLDINETPFTFSVVVDFDGGTNGSATVTAYTESGDKIGTLELAVPSAAKNQGVDTMVEWREYLMHYRVWWNSSNRNRTNDGYLNIHKVYAIEGNVFEN